MKLDAPPPGLHDELRRLTRLELSPAARAGYVSLLLAASAITTIVTALLLTEPAIPRRTSVAFALMMIVGLSWMAFAAWVLTRKRILLGRERVVAGRLAVAFSATFVAGCLAIGAATGTTSSYAAAALGVLMLSTAVVVWVRAQRAFKRLSLRRETLARELGESGR